MDEDTLEKKLRRVEEFCEKAASLPPHEIIELLHQLCDLPEGLEIQSSDIGDLPDDDPNDPELKILIERDEELRKSQLKRDG